MQKPQILRRNLLTTLLVNAWSTAYNAAWAASNPPVRVHVIVGRLRTGDLPQLTALTTRIHARRLEQPRRVVRAAGSAAPTVAELRALIAEGENGAA
jgi:hypothetical protein